MDAETLTREQRKYCIGSYHFQKVKRKMFGLGTVTKQASLWRNDASVTASDSHHWC